MGSRVKLLGRSIERKIWRHYTGRIFATAASIVLGIPVYDTQCGAKLFRAGPEIRSCFEQPFHSRWFFDVELIADSCMSAMLKRLKIWKMASMHLPLPDGGIEGSKLRSIDFVWAGLDLIKIGWIYPPMFNRSRRSSTGSNVPDSLLEDEDQFLSRHVK